MRRAHPFVTKRPAAGSRIPGPPANTPRRMLRQLGRQTQGCSSGTASHGKPARTGSLPSLIVPLLHLPRVPVECEGSLLASFCADREKGSGAVSPVAIVWPCPLAVDAYLAAGRDVGFPRPVLPVVCRAAGVLVGVPALCPGGGPLPEDLRAPAAVRAVRGEPCAAGVHAGLAAGYGRDRRRGGHAGGRRRVRGPPGRGKGGGAIYDRPRLGPPVPGSRRGAGAAFAARADRVAPAGGDRRGGRGQAHRPGTGGTGPADRCPGARAPGRVVAHLLAGHHRPVAAGVAQGRAAGADARAAGR